MTVETGGLERWPGYEEQSWQQRFFELDRQHSKLHADYHRTLLAALAGSSAKVEWQSIDSAPRDGTYVLVSAPDCGCEIVRWSFDTTWTDQAGMTQGNWPTHWQPLPSLPQVPA